jgi:imidazolonepropionase-like amidohydrolase
MRLFRQLLTFTFLSVCGWSQTTVLRNFTLIDGTGKEPLANAALVIVNGRIEQVGPAAGIKAPAGAQVVELKGKFVMPGIINLHTHLGNTMNLAQDPKNFTRQNVELQLKQYSSYGVTSVVSMGTDQDLIFQMREEQRSGRPSMARIFTAGKGFTGPGGYPSTVPGMKGIPMEAGTNEQAVKHIARLADQKVDLVKIWVDDHLGKDKKIPLELCKTIIVTAQKRGLKTAVHIYYLDDAKALVDYGAASLAHSVRDKPVDDALIAAMKKRNVIQLATLTRELSTFVFGQAHPVLQDPFFTRAVSPADLKILRSPENQKKIAASFDYGHGKQYLEMAKKNLKRVADAGVRLGFGTDSGPPMRIPGHFEHWEMELMAEAGVSPQQIVAAATRNAAEFLGVSKDLGTLERGKWADLLVLGRNPLADIKNTRSLEGVYIAGNRAN